MENTNDKSAASARCACLNWAAVGMEAIEQTINTGHHPECPAVRGAVTDEPLKHVWVPVEDECNPFEFPFCQTCGIVQQRDGSSDTRPCKGKNWLREMESAHRAVAPASEESGDQVFSDDCLSKPLCVRCDRWDVEHPNNDCDAFATADNLLEEIDELESGINRLTNTLKDNGFVFDDSKEKWVLASQSVEPSSPAGRQPGEAARKLLDDVLADRAKNAVDEQSPVACRFCGCAAIYVGAREFGKLWEAECKSCGVKTPELISRESAVAVWNGMHFLRTELGKPSIDISAQAAQPEAAEQPASVSEAEPHVMQGGFTIRNGEMTIEDEATGHPVWLSDQLEEFDGELIRITVERLASLQRNEGEEK